MTTGYTRKLTSKEKRTAPIGHGLDEVYTEWYECRACHDTSIMASFTFCPNCGTKLDWPDPAPQREEAKEGK